MVAQFETKITGDKAVMAGLNRVGDALRGKAIRPALLAAALIPMNAAKLKVPRITSNLMRSIHVGGSGDGLESPTDGGDIGFPSDPLAVVVGTDVEYAPYIEFGTSRMAAQPYLRPALDENKDAMVKEFGEALSDIVEAAFR